MTRLRFVIICLLIVSISISIFAQLQAIRTSLNATRAIVGANWARVDSLENVLHNQP